MQIIVHFSGGDYTPPELFSFTTTTHPNLELSTIAAAPTYFTGFNLDLEWEVSNVGSGVPDTYRWYDIVYLTTTPELNLDGVMNLNVLWNYRNFNCSACCRYQGHNVLV